MGAKADTNFGKAGMVRLSNAGGGYFIVPGAGKQLRMM